MGYNPGYKWDKWGQCPLITGVITHLLSGMNHQVEKSNSSGRREFTCENFLAREALCFSRVKWLVGWPKSWVRPPPPLYFSRMRSEGFSLYIWGSGVDRCSRDPASGVRNRSQPLATVRNVRNRPSAAVVASKLPCLYEKLQKRVTFSCLPRRVRRCGHAVLRGKRGTL